MKKKFRSGSNSKFQVSSSKFCEWGLLLLFIYCSLFISCNESAQKKIPETSNLKPETLNLKLETYYCPMHPDVQQDHPGTCPKPECKGMELVKKISDDILNTNLKPVNSSVLSTIKTINPEEKEITIAVEAQGFIDYDNRTKHNTASRYNGRIEKLYVKYNYQPVHKGDRIFDIYSPDLITAQENLIYLLTTDANEIELINAAKEKLKILGFADEQTLELIQTKKIQNSIPVFSKWEGQIHEMLNEKFSANSDGMTSMGGQEAGEAKQTIPVNQLQNTSELTVKEGMYVVRGQTIFNIVDPHEVVVLLQIRAEDIAKVKLNQAVELAIDETPLMVMTGKINFIEPFLKSGSKTLMVRVDINNSVHMHKVGTLVKATINAETVEGLFIPAKSVIDLGKDKMVWLKKEGHFIGRKIETGAITKDWIEILDGITKKDEIAAEAHYLSDSEGFVKISDYEKQ